MSCTSDLNPLRLAVRSAAKVLAGCALGMGIILPAQAFAPLSGPVESTTAVPPNVVILFDNSSSMRGDVNSNYGTGRGTERLVIAKQAVTDVIASNRNLRFGMFVFNASTGSGSSRESHGGRLVASVADISPSSDAGPTNYTNLINTINGITAVRPGESGTSNNNWTYTPLAESYYELTRYMRGLKPFYSPTPASSAADLSSRTAYESPIQYRCQRNFGLIVTDGLPTYDSRFPALAALEPDAGTLAAGQTVQDKLRNWFDAAPSLAGVDLSQEGATFFLNDIAAFAYDTDMRNRSTHGITNDNAGKSWDDSAFPIQNLRTFAVGFSLDDPRLESVAEAGNGNYYTASDSASLTAALNSALLEINAAAGSGGGGAVSSSELAAGSLYYRTLYDPETWRGEIQASSFDESGGLGTVSWSTNTTMTPTQRASKYQTWKVGHGVIEIGSGTFTALPDSQKAILTSGAAVVGGTATGQGLLNWAIGTNNAAPFRARTALLGDIVNSSPAYADPNEATYRRANTGYASYLARKASSMVPSLVVGSNDGFLHVLAARSHTRSGITTTAGKHRLAYLPAAMHSKLGTRARPDYGRAVGHVSGVDGNIIIADAELGSVWTTLALTGFGAGGKGLIAAKLFDGRSSGDGNDALGGLWEIGPAATGFEEIGHIYGRPAVGKLNDQWVAVTGNGYGGESGQAVLYVIKLSDGTLVKSIEVGAAGGNGLSGPRLQVDQNGDIVAAFAGDLKGQLWKFDLSSSENSEWSSAFTASSVAKPLFTAAANQPITVTPELYRHPQGGQLVLFGTGKFMEHGDLTSNAEQAYYAVWDKPGSAGNLARTNLLAQSISESGGSRTVTSSRVNWDSQAGWYLPLKVGSTLKGERVTRNSVVRGNRVFFNTGFIDTASTDPCISNANGWLMALDVFSGGKTPTAMFDSNSDGRIDGSDTITAGIKLDIGLPGDLTFVSRPGSGVLLDGRSETVPDLSSWTRETVIGGRLGEGLLRPVPRTDDDGEPVPVSGNYFSATSKLCNPTTQSCECPVGSTSCLSDFSRPNCEGGRILAGGSRDVKAIDLRLHCVAKRIAWRQRM